MQPSTELVKDTIVPSDGENDSQSSKLLLKPNTVPAEIDIMNKLSGETGSQAELEDPDFHNFGSHDSVDEKSKVSRKSSFLSSILQVADKHATKTNNNSRPMSAPSRSSSTTMVTGTCSSVTLPSQFNVSELKVLRLKQQSEIDERQKRRLNIEESARAALHYSAKRQSLKTMSLPRDHRSSSLSAASFISCKSGEKRSGRKSSSPAVMGSNSSPTYSHDETSPFDDPNLTNSNVEEAKDSNAQILQTDELWDQIEQTGRSKEREVTITSDPALMVTSVSEELKSSGTYCDDSESRKSYVVEETAIFVSFEESHSQTLPGANLQDTESSTSNGIHTSKTTLRLPPTVNGNNGRHRTASFSNKRKSFVKSNLDFEKLYFLFIEIDSLLQTLRSLSAHDEEVEELKILEGMLKSNTFKKAKQVNSG